MELASVGVVFSSLAAGAVVAAVARLGFKPPRKLTGLQTLVENQRAEVE
jgi:hypothetical protein